jgi:hypothetical protein
MQYIIDLPLVSLITKLFEMIWGLGLKISV